jgi:tRNA(Ile)-lysidine synthase
MNTFVKGLITEWRRLQLPVTGETVVIAVSGGADSLSLMLALAELRQTEKLDVRLVAAHFNHGLRGEEADADEQFIRSFSSEYRMELAVGRGDVPRDGNLEQNARRARYQFLQSTAENLGAGLIVTAHTLNDQAETFVLNLLRGSGLSGLGGITPVRELKDPAQTVPNEEMPDISPQAASHDETSYLPFLEIPITLARPLLNWAKREDTENYCRHAKVDFRYDSMNEDLSFRRVRVRKILLPAMAEFNPQIVETLANTAELMRLAASQGSLPSQIPTVELRSADLKELPQAQLYDTLRGWLEQRRGNLRGLELKHIKAIERLLLSRKSGKTVELPGGQNVSKRSGSLVFEGPEVEKSSPEH